MKIIFIETIQSNASSQRPFSNKENQNFREDHIYRKNSINSHVKIKQEMK